MPSAWLFSDHCFKDVQLGFVEIKLSCNWHLCRWWQHKCIKFFNGLIRLQLSAHRTGQLLLLNRRVTAPSNNSTSVKYHLKNVFSKYIKCDILQRFWLWALRAVLSASACAHGRDLNANSVFSSLRLSLTQHLASGNTISYRSALSFLQINNRLADAPRKLDQGTLTSLLECSRPL